MVTGITAVQGGRPFPTVGPVVASAVATPSQPAQVRSLPSQSSGFFADASSSVSSLWRSASNLPWYAKAGIGIGVGGLALAGGAAALGTAGVLKGLALVAGLGTIASCTPDTTSATDGGVNPDAAPPPRGRVDSYPAGGELCVWLDKDKEITSVTLQDGTGKNYVTALPSTSQLEAEIKSLKLGSEVAVGWKFNAHYLPYYLSRKNFPQNQPTRHFFMSTGNAVFSRNGKNEADGFVALWQTGETGNEIKNRNYFPDFRVSDPFYRASNLKATTSPLLFPEGGSASWQSGANSLNALNLNVLRIKDGSRMGPILAVGLGPEIAGDPLKRNISILVQNPTSKKYEWKAVIDGAVDYVAGGYGYLLGASSDNTCSSFYPEITTDQDVKGDSDTVRALKEQIRQSKAQLATLGVTL